MDEADAEDEQAAGAEEEHGEVEEEPEGDDENKVRATFYASSFFLPLLFLYLFFASACFVLPILLPLSSPFFRFFSVLSLPTSLPPALTATIITMI